MEIGIIGYGTVGKALLNGFRNRAQMHVFDPLYAAQSTEPFKSSVEEVWQASDFTFVAVPTPQKLSANEPGGPFDASNLDATVASVASLPDKKGPRGGEKVLILVSTTLPSKVKAFLETYPRLNLVVLPEFLTERNAERDFLNPSFRIVGGNPEHARAVNELFENYSDCAPCKVGYCDAVAAAFIKYMINSYLAVKLSFLNQFYDLFQRGGSESTWEQVSELFHFDVRVGNSHKNIPGHDGDRGWGGRCLPKDVNAIMRDAAEQGCPLRLLEEAWEYNLSIRSDIDWK